MKKRIFSLLLALAMIVSVSTAFAAPISIGDTAENVYEGNKPFMLAEKLIDQLYDDKNAAEIFDVDGHDYQHRRIKKVNEYLVEEVTTEDLADAIDLLTKDMSDAQKMYLYAQVRATKPEENAFKLRLDAVDPVGGLPLRESFGLLDNYIEDMRGFFNVEGITVELYDNDNAVKESAKAIVAEPLIAILKVMFAQDGTSNSYDDSGKYMRENYLEEFIANDRAKKTLAVLFGAELTEEIVKDSFLSSVESGNQAGKTIGIVHHVKKYLSDNPGTENNSTAIRDLKIAVEDGVLNPSRTTSVRGAFDAIGELVVEAYEHDLQASDSLKDSVKMLMGDGENEGLVELMVNAVDKETSLAASNIWINLFLSEFVQTNITNGDTLYTISAATPNPTPAGINNGSEVTFKNENLSDYGIGDNNISLRTGKFTLRFYVTDPSYVAPSPGGSSGGGSSSGSGGGGSSSSGSGGGVGASPVGSEPEYEGYIKTDYINYDGQDGKITIGYDSSFAEGETYPAYMVLYRSNVASENTFIESYPVTVTNPRKPSSGGGGSSKIYLNYNTNGGDKINSTSHTRGSVVELNKVPVREGYIFTGWYSDEALTQKIDSVTITASTTVYAGWKKDGSAVVSVVDIPELLEGENHYAYIMGYPEGDVRPYGNITRAETVTMVFRLLKDSVRTSNLTETNSFYDVDENDWFNTAVSTLAGMGIVEGRTETKFMPNAYITRAEFATIFARLAEYDVATAQDYSDIDNHWAEDYIREASAYGWIAGYEDDTFRPDKAINRAEAMTLVNRVLKRVPESKEDLLPDMTVWSDNADTTAWYYLAVQEATNSHNFEMKDESYEKWTVLTENRDWTVFEK